MGWRSSVSHQVAVTFPKAVLAMVPSDYRAFGKVRKFDIGSGLSYTAAQLNSECTTGGMAEWTIAAVLKTVVGQLTGGSNPSPSVVMRLLARGGARVDDRSRLLSG